MTTCPTCSKPVDPLRARAVSVRDGKVVAFCSAECAAKAEPSKPNLAPAREASAPVVAPPRPATPAKGIPQPPRPPTTPATGVPARGRRDFESGPVIEILHEPASGVVTSARDERVPSGPVPAIRAEATPPTAETETPFEPDDDEDDDEDDDDADDDESGADDNADDAPAEPEAGTSMVRKRRDSMNAKAAWDWLDDEPAEPVRAGTSADDDDARPRSGMKVFVWLLVLALAGGGGYLAYKYIYLPRSAASVQPEPPGLHVVPGSVEQLPPPKPLPPPPPPPAKALDRATEILRTYVASKSQRIQRLAAGPLARTGDKAAIAVLVAAVGDKSDPLRIVAAYELARGGDKRGADALAAMLASQSRDDKLAAGKALARLGDPRASEIASYLDVSQNRLSVAVELARIAEPHAIKALEQIHADPKSSPDEKARAAIGLGLAGRTDVVAELHALLDDTHFNVDAGEALALLHDETARTVLVKLLDVSSLRVGAARALRRLGAASVASHVKALVAALDDPEKKKDTVQIELAETILLLAGPESWSEHL